jgi:hypothetical protein
MREVKVFLAEDQEQFDTKAECLRYERALAFCRATTPTMRLAFNDVALDDAHQIAGLIRDTGPDSAAAAILTLADLIRAGRAAENVKAPQ